MPTDCRQRRRFVAGDRRVRPGAAASSPPGGPRSWLTTARALRRECRKGWLEQCQVAMTSPASPPCWLRPRQRVLADAHWSRSGRAAPLSVLHAASSALPPASLLVAHKAADRRGRTLDHGPGRGSNRRLGTSWPGSRDSGLCVFAAVRPNGAMARERIAAYREGSLAGDPGRRAVVPSAQERLFARVRVQQALRCGRQPTGLTAAAYVVP